MKRNDYQKPTMKVVQLKHRTQMLQASGGVQVTMKKNQFVETDSWDEGE